GDVFSASYTGANFSDKNAGASKQIAVTGISIAGPDAAHYTYSPTTLAYASIMPRTFTVTADSKNITYGATPVYSASYSGFTGDDTASVVSGAPAFSTNAMNSRPTAGSWTILPSVG